MHFRALRALSARSEDCREALGTQLTRGKRVLGSVGGKKLAPKIFSLPHTQSSESRPRRPFVECVCVCVCLGVGGVPHQLWWGGSKDSAAKSGGAARAPP